MATLYELTDQYQQLLELESEIDEQTFIDTLQSIDEAIEDKAENLAKVIKEMEAEFKKILDIDYDASKEIEKNTMDLFMASYWKDLPMSPKGAVLNPVNTEPFSISAVIFT